MLYLYYSVIALLAIFVLLIVNFKYFIVRDKRAEVVEFKGALISIGLFFIADTLWGIFMAYGNPSLCYADTVIFYLTMNLSVVFCCRYIIAYLHLRNYTGKIINNVAIAFFVIETVTLIINHFTPIFFEIDENCNYVALPFRHFILGFQILIFLLISFISLKVARKEIFRKGRRRNTAIFLFSICITLALFTQYLFPLLPMYSIGMMLGLLIIHIFVHNEEMNIHMKKISDLNEKLLTEQKALQKQKDEIATAFAIINVLSRDYHTIWLADKKTRKIEMVRGESGKHAIKEAVQLALQFDNCDEAMSAYIEHFVCEEDQERMRKNVNFENIAEILSKKDYYAINYKRHLMKGVTDYNQMTFANVKTTDGKMQFVFGFRDVNDIVQQEMALRKEIDDAKVAAEANITANNAKTKFLQNMSHEIRTPLNAMFGFSQLLGMPDGSWTEEEKQQYNAYIYNSYRMLEMLINDIIDIADSEHDNYRIELSDVNLNEVCRSATMSVEFRVPVGVNLSFTTEYPDDYVINSDGRRIQQVLINYLTNACKNTQKGEITLSCSKTEHPGKITFAVTDTGRGVPPEMASLIFNRFTKLDQFVQGSGLGLNICMTVADKLGGEVYLDTTYTNGARFVFVIDDKTD